MPVGPRPPQRYGVPSSARAASSGHSAGSGSPRRVRPGRRPAAGASRRTQPGSRAGPARAARAARPGATSRSSSTTTGSPSSAWVTRSAGARVPRARRRAGPRRRSRDRPECRGSRRGAARRRRTTTGAAPSASHQAASRSPTSVVPTAATRLPAAATPMPVSIIEPTMVPMPWRAARASWSRAACQAAGLGELDVDQVGGAPLDHRDQVGEGEHRLVGHHRRAHRGGDPGQAVEVGGGTGCSTSSTPAPASSSARITRIAWSGVQPWLASSRSATDGPTAARTARTRATSVAASVPTFSLSAVNPSATRSRAAAARSSAVARGDRHVGGRRRARRAPSSTASGTPARRAARSWRAMSRPALAPRPGGACGPTAASTSPR